MFWLSHGRLIGGVCNDTETVIHDRTTARSGIQRSEDRRDHKHITEHHKELVQTSSAKDRRCMYAMRRSGLSMPSQEKEAVLFGPVQACLVVAASGGAQARHTVYAHLPVLRDRFSDKPDRRRILLCRLFCQCAKEGGSP